MPNSTIETIWVGIGLLGQLLFTGRFLVQWICSESARKSVIPPAFWYLSMAGGVTLLSYAIYRGDPVFILGQSTGVFIYLRNIYFMRIEQKELAGSDSQLVTVELATAASDAAISDSHRKVA